MVLDGTIVACDRVAGTTISRKGKVRLLPGVGHPGYWILM
jgi:hypothetical protein